MPGLILVSRSDLTPELGRTVLWRGDVLRTQVEDPEGTFDAARLQRPRLIVLDGLKPRPTADLISRLRADPETRPSAIVVIGRSPSIEEEEAFRRAGANAVVRPPVDPLFWDGRLEELLFVPRRRDARVEVHLAVWSAPNQGNDRARGIAENVSLHGMLLTTELPLEVGAKLDLSFRLPGQGPEISVLGQVVRDAGELDRRRACGVEFLVLRGDAREQIHRFVTAALEREPAPAQEPARALTSTEASEWEAVLRASEARKTAVVESAFDAIITADQDGRIIEFNRAAERLFGLERSRALARSLLDTILPPAVRPSHRSLLRPGPERGGRRIETLGLHGSGRQFPVELVLTPVQTARRRLYTAYLRDLSERERRRRRMAAAHAAARALVETRTVDEALPRLLAALGSELGFDLAAVWRGEGPDGLRCTARWSPAHVDPGAVQHAIEGAVQGAEAPVPRALGSGRPVWLDRSATAARWPTAVVLPLPVRDGPPSAIGLMSQTVHTEDSELLAQLAVIAGQVAESLERRKAEHRLSESEARHRALLRAMPDLILQLSHEGVCIDCNVPVETRGLLSPAKFNGRHLSDALPVGVARLLVQHLGRALATGEIQTFESEISLAGVPHRWEIRVAACGDLEALALVRDVTDRKRAEEQIRTLAYRDSLTELPNRLLFQDRLRIALAQAHRQQLRPSVLILDLDRFKQINDSLGHGFGDRVLREVAGRLARNVREGDTVARLGGDEFSLLVPDAATSTDVARVAGKLLDQVRRPLRIEGHEVFVTPSIGISVYPGDGRDVETLIKNAEVALYRGKERGGNGYQLYAPAMNARAAERLALENSLRHAAAREEFELHYQPVADIQRGRIWGVEALLRWRHPELGLVLPDDFVPLAESAGLLGPIAPWVLRTACRQVRDWQRQHGMELWVAVNLSLRQFQHPSLVRLAAEALEAAGLPPRCLALEITETSAMQNAEVTIHTLRQLRTLGIRVAIDDFGVGYSSLSHLRRLPLDTLKIDRSFVRDIANDPGDAAIVRAMVALARSLGLTVVAEGVETEAQLGFLRDCHCDGMQGYLLSPPLPPDACGELLQAHA